MVDKPIYKLQKRNVLSTRTHKKHWQDHQKIQANSKSHHIQRLKSVTINSHGADSCKVETETAMTHHKSFTITPLSKTSGINANLTHPLLSYYSLLRTEVHDKKQEGKSTWFTNLPNSNVGSYRYSNLLNWCLFVILFTDIRVLVKGNGK